MVQAALAEGYILAPYFSEALPLFEKQESALNLYYVEMIQAINLVKEDERLTGYEFAKSTAPGAVVKTPSAPPPPVVTGAQKTLQDAELAYGSRELAKSKALKSAENMVMWLPSNPKDKEARCTWACVRHIQRY